MELTKRQRNDIFETLAANGVEPESCHFEDLTNEPLSPSLPSGPVRPNERWLYERYSHSDSLIRHEPSQSAFTFWPDSSRGAERYRAIMAVGSADWGSCSSCDWEQLLESLAEWVKEVSYESVAPDLWAQLKHVPAVMAAAQGENASNSPFTPDERAEISRGLDEIKKLVREKFELNSEQLSAIEQTLDEVKEAGQRLGRKYWLLVFYGGMVSTFMTDAVPPSVIQTIMTTVVHGIAHIFGIGGARRP